MTAPQQIYGVIDLPSLTDDELAGLAAGAMLDFMVVDREWEDADDVHALALDIHVPREETIRRALEEILDA